MIIKQLSKRLSKIESYRARDNVNWRPNIFIWCDGESTEEAKARWEKENRLLTGTDRVCYIGWMTD